MIQSEDLAFYQAGANYVQSKIDCRPKIGLILGTALGGLADEITNRIVIPYSEIPNFLLSTVDSHAGELIIGDLNGRKVICMSGRFHYYEGYDFAELVRPIRLFKLLGVEKLILTNAAGGINLAYRPGDIMIINDHINFPLASPTRGRNIEEFGPRFFDMSNAYDSNLRQVAVNCSQGSGLNIHQGVYAFTAGPHFETPAEIRFYRLAGCDAVGMSTVTEVITAAQCGIKILAISLITNMAAGVLPTPIDGKEVDEVGAKVRVKLSQYLQAIIANI